MKDVIQQVKNYLIEKYKDSSTQNNISSGYNGWVLENKGFYALAVQSERETYITFCNPQDEDVTKIKEIIKGSGIEFNVEFKKLKYEWK